MTDSAKDPVKIMTDAMATFTVFDDGEWKHLDPEVCRVMARCGVSALGFEGLEIVENTCPECGRFLDLHCTVHGSRSWPEPR